MALRIRADRIIVTIERGADWVRNCKTRFFFGVRNVRYACLCLSTHACVYNGHLCVSTHTYVYNGHLCVQWQSTMAKHNGKVVAHIQLSWCFCVCTSAMQCCTKPCFFLAVVLFSAVVLFLLIFHYSSAKKCCTKPCFLLCFLRVCQ